MLGMGYTLNIVTLFNGWKSMQNLQLPSFFESIVSSRSMARWLLQSRLSSACPVSVLCGWLVPSTTPGVGSGRWVWRWVLAGFRRCNVLVARLPSRNSRCCLVVFP
ncbi:Uncharacterized protein APZ42_003921 [Daphnia magna]|uniref:Uncharacterized protein n=1 Tax=Daphnia magna TaxID=35525 RepID=A0A164HCU8_9CRUS|nr:Uncharacterized protein APZ42_003921 [Daphnia magna]